MNLSPKRGIRDFLHEYLEAERIGQSYNMNMSCAKAFPECPVSQYNLFRLSAAESDENQVDDDDAAENVESVSSQQPPAPDRSTLEDDYNNLFSNAPPQLMDKSLYQTDKPFTYFNSLDY